MSLYVIFTILFYNNFYLQHMKNKYRHILILWLLCSFTQITSAQAPKVWTSADIHESIKKLNFLGSALYVAAHPDDENTRMIAYLANEVKANVAYLSLTRGDGGQNLIGTEIQELLGVIRTQELLAARRIDGGNQLFSRANDFGYSKHPDETLKIWNEEEVVSDVVWAIRKWQPDVIINRFDHRTAGRTHGHHTSSAVLSHQVFDMTNDKTVFPEQLKYVQPWQARRLFMNTSWWFYGSREKFAKADKSKMLSVDVGVYYPIKGKSNTEIAGESRSQHKCQGMGNSGGRGSMSEYLELLKGDLPKDKANMFDGINTTWTRLKGGKAIGDILAMVEKDFDYSNPTASLPNLVKAYRLIKALPDGYWKQVKQAEIEKIIEGSLAMFLEATANDYTATPGEEIELTLEMTNRSSGKVTLKSMTYLPNNIDTTINLVLENNVQNKLYKTLTLPEDIAFTNPYWLNKAQELGMYTVEKQELRGLPETPRQLKVKFSLEVEGEPIDLIKEVVYKKTDPVDGIVYRPFEITPPVFVNLTDKVIVFASNEAKSVGVLVKSGAANIQGKVTLAIPNDWKIEPEFINIDLKQKGEEQLISFKLFPPEAQSEGLISPMAMVGDETYTKELVLIEYDHIPTQTVVRNAESKIVKIDLKKDGQFVAYIMGAGDKIPESLRQVGYEVDVLKDSEITLENLKRYDAVILGIRAYNTEERLKFHQSKLMDYVEQGGTMIVQYNTHRRLKVPMEEIAPYPLKISRDRVSVEEAEVRILAPKHVVINYPNKITSKDFEGWIQERGLYFPNEWDKKFTPILSSNDPGEKPKEGGLLVTEYGKGHYIYSGYSWFRELPAGVPGAYRLFTNLISLGNGAKP